MTRLLYWFFIALLLFLIILLSLIIVKLSEKNRNSNKIEGVCQKWILNLIQSKTIGQYFVANGIRNVGIIGYNLFSYVLERELYKCGINVVFCLDDNSAGGLSQIPGLSFIQTNDWNAYKDSVDMVIITEERVSKGRERNRSLIFNNECKTIGLYELILFTSELSGGERNN